MASANCADVTTALARSVAESAWRAGWSRQQIDRAIAPLQQAYALDIFDHARRHRLGRPRWIARASIGASPPNRSASVSAGNGTKCITMPVANHNREEQAERDAQPAMQQDERARHAVRFLLRT